MSHLIILAAGKGTRMKSSTSKLLTPVKGVPLIARLLKNVESFSARPTLVVGHQAENVIRATGALYHYIFQDKQMGTGHALSCALSSLEDVFADTILVVYGDHPLISASTLKQIEDTKHSSGAVAALGTIIVPHFEGVYFPLNHYGRIIRDDEGSIVDIKEFKDANETERRILEVNPGFYCFDRKWLIRNISKLENSNAAGEFYLTDIIKIALMGGQKVATLELSSISSVGEALGINTPEELALVESFIEKNERGEKPC